MPVWMTELTHQVIEDVPLVDVDGNQSLKLSTLHLSPAIVIR